MKEHKQDVGDTGKLIIQDKTDTSIASQKYVDFYIQSLSPVAIPNLPWRWYTDEAPDINKQWKSFNFKNTTLRQHLGLFYVGYAHQVSLLIGNTGTSQMDGPATFTVDLATVLRPVSVKFGNTWKQAIPYVRVGGIWKPSVAMVMKDGNWKEST